MNPTLTVTVRPPVTFTDLAMLEAREKPTAFHAFKPTSTPEQAQVQSSNPKLGGHSFAIAGAIIGLLCLVGLIWFILRVGRSWYRRRQKTKAKAQAAQADQQRWLGFVRQSYASRLGSNHGHSNTDLEKGLNNVRDNSSNDLPLRNTAPLQTTELEVPGSDRDFQMMAPNSAKQLMRNGIPLQRFVPSASSRASSAFRHVQTQGGYSNIDGVLHSSSNEQVPQPSREHAPEAWWAHNTCNSTNGSGNCESIESDISHGTTNASVGEAVPMTLRPISPTMVKLPASTSCFSLINKDADASPFVIGDNDEEDGTEESYNTRAPDES